MENTNSLKKSVSVIGFAALLMILSQQLVATVGSGIIAAINPNFANQPYAMWLISCLPLYLVGVPIFLLIVKNTANTDSGKEQIKLPLATFVKWWFISMAAMWIFNIVSQIINIAIGLLKGGNVLNPVVEMQQGSGIIYNIIFGVIIAPIGEELLLRYVLYKKLAGYGDKVFIFTSALVFACIHGNISQLFYAFALGIIFAYIMARTRKVIYCIAMHILINAYGMVLAPLCLGNEMAIMMLGTMLIAIVIFGGILLVRTKKKGFIIDEPSLEVPQNSIKAILTAPGIIGIILLCITLCVVTILI